MILQSLLWESRPPPKILLKSSSLLMREELFFVLNASKNVSVVYTQPSEGEEKD